MLKIGDFSKICQVSVKALRHWDAVGLLTPAVTDPQTGYRYYSIEQVSDVNRILAFRSMGLGLPQIAQLLHEHPTTDDIRAMLRLKQAELEQQIADVAIMLKVVETRLRQIDHGGVLPDYEVALKAIPTQPIVAVRAAVPTLDTLVDLLRETHGFARQRTSTNLLAVFHDEGYETQQIDVEVGFPVEHAWRTGIPLADGREMRPAELPGVEVMATTIHHGPWLTLSHGYVHLGRWIVANGYEIVGAGREVFHHIDWEHEQAATVTELQFPVQRRSS